MPKVTNAIDSLNRRARLIKESADKSVTENTEIMLRETRDKVADEILSQKASDVIKAIVSPQIKRTLPESAEKI